MYENVLNDSTDTIKYKAYVTGRSYEQEDYPKLDSISFDISHKIINTNTTTVIEKIKAQKQRKWHLSPSIGIGYGLTQQKPDIYIGISLNYTIF